MSKKKTIKNSSNNSETTSNNINVNSDINNNSSIRHDHKRIIDLLDIRLLLTVIVFVASGWAYLNNSICEFTMTEPHNERMSYIVVHYILSTMLILCIGITYIKSKYLLKSEVQNFSVKERLYIDLFIDSWLIVLLMCVLIIIFNSILPWWLALLFYSLSILLYMLKKRFGLWESTIIPLMILVFFPLFISAMTNIIKKVDISVLYNREIDLVSIEVDAKSYDCNYFVKGIVGDELRLGKDYNINGSIIQINRAHLRDNLITISTVSPAGGSEFFKYPIKKILGFEKTYVMPKNASMYNKSQILNIE